MSATLSLALAALTASSPGAAPADLIAKWVRAESDDRVRVNVWLNRDDPYQRGDQARIYFKSDHDAYVTVVRIDTDGRVRVLFPIDPWEDNWARGGRTFEVLGRDRDEAFRIDDYPGVGYIFAIASPDPFSYDDIVRGDHWDYREISDGRVRGDPYVAVSDLADRIAGHGQYDYDVIEYDVEQHYDYPRFVCYDCHSYASWHYWDPYSSYCSRFRIVIYDDWYYYPYRRYGGGVVVRPYRPGPRFVFKDADRRNDFVTRVAERPRFDGPRRPPEGNRTSADVGGRGSIPTPISPRHRTGDDAGRGVPGNRPSGDEPRRRAPDPRGQSDARPDAQPNGDREPRRRTDPTGPDKPQREAPRPSEDRGRRPDPSGQTDPQRDAPRPNSDDRPRRRGVEERPDRVAPDDHRSARPDDRRPVTRQLEPDREPMRPVPSERSRPESRGRPPEPSRPEPRAEAPRERERPRAEPRSAPEPRSTGEPQLKRRRP
jgi:hypothetical protein